MLIYAVQVNGLIFTHFLKRLFSPIMGRSEEPNMGLPILGSQLKR